MYFSNLNVIVTEDWTLRISPVLLEDDAMFQCQVGAADGVAPIRSRSAQLTVYVPPEDPFIEQGELLEVTEDMDTSLNCVSPGGKPAADVSSAFLSILSISDMGRYFRFTGTMEMAMLLSRMSGPVRTCWRTERGLTPPP